MSMKKRTVGKDVPSTMNLPDGNFPAVEYARASLARKIIRQRTKLGLSQKELAQLAGLPAETLCRIERGQQTPTTASIVKIDRALQRAEHRTNASSASKRKAG